MAWKTKLSVESWLNSSWTKQLDNLNLIRNLRRRFQGWRQPTDLEYFKRVGGGVVLGSLSRGSLAEELATADPQADAKVRVAVGPIRVPDAKKHRIKNSWRGC